MGWQNVHVVFTIELFQIGMEPRRTLDRLTFKFHLDDRRIVAFVHTLYDAVDIGHHNAHMIGRFIRVFLSLLNDFVMIVRTIKIVEVISRQLIFYLFDWVATAISRHEDLKPCLPFDFFDLLIMQTSLIVVVRQTFYWKDIHERGIYFVSNTAFSTIHTLRHENIITVKLPVIGKSKRRIVGWNQSGIANFTARKLHQLFTVGSRHVHINIVIPRDKTFVAYRAKQSPTGQIIG